MMITRENIACLSHSLLLMAMMLLGFHLNSSAQGTAVSSINASYFNTTQTSYSGAGWIPTSDFPSTSTYNMVFGSSATTNNDYTLSATSSFVSSGATFDLVQMATELRIRRNSVSAVGEKQLIGGEHRVLPSTASGSTIDMRNTQFTTMENEFRSMRLNLSGDQTFVNTASGLSWNNVERLDYIFQAGLQSDTPDNSGFALFERGGNDGFTMAAILEVDVNGDPSKLGPLYAIPSSRWGPALKSLEQTVFDKEQTDTYFKPAMNLTGQSVHGMYVSFSDLDIQENEVFYGYCLMGKDVNDNSIDWTDSSVYPTNTSSSNGGVDFCPLGGAFTSDGGATATDSDGDGISDLLDIDDDNDGLLDLDESICDVDNWQIGWFHSAGTSPTIYTTDLIQSGGNESYGSGVTGTIASTLLTVSGISSTTLTDAKVNGDYVQYGFTTLPVLAIDYTLSELTHYVHSSSINTGHKMAVEISDDSFVTSTLLIKDEVTGFGGFYEEFWAIQHFYQLKPATAYTMRVYLYDVPPAHSGKAILDDFVLDVCDTYLDHDQDGVMNHLDSDSDNDGIYDVFEASGIDPDLDGYIGSGSITDTDGDGWSDITDSDNGGTALADPDTDSDAFEDRIDYDSDADGCSDTIEAGFPDTDGDGQLGGMVPPTVNSSGTVTSGGL